MFNERIAIEKRMDQIFRRVSLLHAEFDQLFNRLRELDLMESNREIPYPVRIVATDQIAMTKEIIEKDSRQNNLEPSKKCENSDCLSEVVRILKESPIPVRASILRKKLEECGFSYKNFTSYMNELMKKDDRILRSSRGFYEFKSDE